MYVKDQGGRYIVSIVVDLPDLPAIKASEDALSIVLGRLAAEDADPVWFVFDQLTAKGSFVQASETATGWSQSNGADFSPGRNGPAPIPATDILEDVQLVEDALRRAVSASTADAAKWGDLGFAELDELAICDSHVATMTSEQRAAYVGQLVHDIALMYGLPGYRQFESVDEEGRQTPAGLLRRLLRAGEGERNG